MLKHSIDEITLNREGNIVVGNIKGWTEKKEYTISIRADGKELCKFSNNVPRYDVCSFLGEEIEDNLYGFESEFQFETDNDVLEVYVETSEDKECIGSFSVSGKEMGPGKLRRLWNYIVDFFYLAWKQYHFLVPLSFIKEYFRDIKLQQYDMNQLFDPTDGRQYREWLYVQKYVKGKDYTDITFITSSKIASRFKRLEMNEKLDLSQIASNYICFVGSQCKLYPQFYGYLHECEDADLVYFDHDEYDSGRCNPVLKPDYSFDTLRGTNYIGNVFIIRKTLLGDVDGKPIDLYNILLEASEKNIKVKHISKILYQDNSVIDSPYASARNHLNKHDIDAEIEELSTDTCSVKYKIYGTPKVSIVIPTKDHIDVLDTCIQSIFAKTTYKNYEIIIIDNNSELSETKEYLKDLCSKQDNVFSHELNVPFNYSYLNNTAVKEFCSGDYILLLNNDTEVITGDWIEWMLGYAQQPGIGTVGALLLFPDDTIQHAGIIMGKGGIAGHSHYLEPVEGKRYGYSLSIPYNVSCCTAACLMMSKDKYLEIGGLNETLQVAFNDVDFGLKFLEHNYRNVFLPHVKLYHYESKSRGTDTTKEKMKRFMGECHYMEEHYAGYIDKDPFLNDNLSRENNNMLRLRKD